MRVRAGGKWESKDDKFCLPRKPLGNESKCTQTTITDMVMVVRSLRSTAGELDPFPIFHFPHASFPFLLTTNGSRTTAFLSQQKNICTPAASSSGSLKKIRNDGQFPSKPEIGRREKSFSVRKKRCRGLCP